MTLPIDHHIWQQIDSLCFGVLCTCSLCVFQAKNSKPTNGMLENKEKNTEKFWLLPIIIYDDDGVPQKNIDVGGGGRGTYHIRHVLVEYV